MDVTITPARPHQYAAIGELVAGAYLDGGLLDFGEADPYLEKLRDAAGRAAHAELLVAEDEQGAVLGSVTFVPGQGPYAERARPGEGEFRMLAVRESARGRGVGEALVTACVERARARGLTGLVLSTQHSMHAAHRLYERLGFVRTPERDWYPLDGVRLWTYALRL
ncbi:GNAT family N-acetyltransferase [Streptomyces albus subsp. chlorinus]|uniref:GNAT family N-acetyltransferase n=1 Tax=Streptomyces albus TaxID=1888 RepID=UPI00156EC706|nr:GNAT family N-acetyltransferase [Streptomyces albus]NSC23799.1 GNAT family N-acetyltransferase [Streptomyces albus subsp. chlorinus]